MSEIARSGKWNPGGGRWLEVVPAFGVASYSRLSSAHAPVIVLKDGFSWTRIYCTQGTIGYKEEPNPTDNGRTWDYDIKGLSLYDAKAKRLALDNLLIYEQMLCRFCDNDGLIRVAGTPTESLTFSYDLSTDTTVGGSRGYALSLKGTTRQPAAYE